MRALHRRGELYFNVGRSGRQDDSEAVQLPAGRLILTNCLQPSYAIRQPLSNAAGGVSPPFGAGLLTPQFGAGLLTPPRAPTPGLPCVLEACAPARSLADGALESTLVFPTPLFPNLRFATPPPKLRFTSFLLP